MPVKPALADAARDGGHDRRPVRRPAAVRSVRRRRRVAGARRGRHPALHGLLPDRRPARGRPRPQLAAVLHRLGVRVAPAVRARRRLAAGEGAARLVQGPGLLRLQRRRVPLGWRPLPVADQARASRPTTCTPTASTCGGSRGGSAPNRSPGQKPAWNFATPRRSRSGPRAARSPCPTSRTRSPTSTTATPTATSARSPARASRWTPAQGPGRADQRHRHGRQLRAAQRRQPQEPARGAGHGHGQGLDRDQRQDDPRHLEEAGVPGQDPVLRPQRQPGDADAWPDFVQVVPRSATITVKDGKVPAPTAGVRRGARAAGTARSGRPIRLGHRIGAGRATSAHTARVSRATSAQVRAPRRARARRRPALPWSASSDHTARIAVARRAGSPGSTRIPAGADDLRQRPDRARHDGHGRREGVEGGDPRGLGAHGLDEEPRPGHERGEALLGQARRVGDRVGDARADGGARHGGAVARRRAHEADPRRPRALGDRRRRGSSAASDASAANSVGRSWRAS